MYLCPCVCVLYRMSLHSARINAFVENYISNEKEVQIFVRCLREVTVHEIDSKINLHYIDFTRFHFACVFPKKFCIYTVCIVCIITVYTYYMYIYIYIWILRYNLTIMGCQKTTIKTMALSQGTCQDVSPTF